MKQSQKERIVNWLKKGHTITQTQALKRFGVLCLHSRITELRNDNYPIDTEMVRVKSRYGVARVAKYRMAK